MKEDEDWNLKGKKLITSDGYAMLDLYEPKDGESGFYIDEDIKFLRKKIIEDIDSLDCTNKGKLKKWELIEEVLDIIDKRFGINEIEIKEEKKCLMK
jgi:hypothetical protein